MTRRSWLLRPPDPGAAALLLCLPYAGVGASMYARWPRWIGPVEICPIQPPGRENRLLEPPCATFEQYAAELVDDLAPHLAVPFALFGHCSSALAAYATTLELLSRGLPPPVRLVVSAQVAPQDGPVGRYLGHTDEQLRGELVAVNRRLGEDPDPVLLDLGVDVLRADVEAHRRYVVAEPARLPIPLTTVGWRDDEDVPPTATAGWSRVSPRVHGVVVDGDHFSVLSPPPSLFADLVRTLGEDLGADWHVESGVR